MDYHNNYFEPGAPSVRNCRERWTCIKPFIKEESTLFDVGCSGGWFCLAAEVEKLVDFTGIDKEMSLIDECNEIKEHYKIHGGFMRADASMFTSPLATHVDTILCLSVFHHIVAEYDWQDASAYLMNMSLSCDQLFFECSQKGENCNEHTWWAKLPSDWDSTQEEYLLSNTVFDKCDKVGGSKVHGVERPLYRLYADTSEKG